MEGERLVSIYQESLVLVTRDSLRQLRQSMGMTQVEFGTHFGVERNTVTRWEMGLNQPKGKRRRTIARIIKRKLAQQEVMEAYDDDGMAGLVQGE